MADRVNLTPAVRRALAVLAAHGVAYESNTTSAPGSDLRPLIYWQSARALSHRRLIVKRGGPGGWTLTADGWAVARDLRLAGEQIELWQA